MCQVVIHLSWLSYLFILEFLIHCFIPKHNLSFFGISIVSDLFMGAVEKITSATRQVKLSGAGDDEPDVIEVRVWNGTVANLTLMALGSSAPEICLAIIGVIGNNFESDALGPGTIVGSAAYNLLAISAVCVFSIPGGETRR